MDSESVSYKSFINLYGEKIITNILNNVSDLVSIINENFIIEYVNEDIHYKFLGYLSSELVGTSILELFRKKEFRKAKIGIKEIFKKGIIRDIVKIKAKNEKHLALEFTGKRFKDIDGKSKIVLIGKPTEKLGALANYRNSTGKLQEYNESFTEIRFWKLLQPEAFSNALEKSYEIFQFILNNIPLQVAWKNAKDLSYLGCNKKFAEFLGYEDPIQLIGKTDFEIKWISFNKAEFHKKEYKTIQLDNPQYHDIQLLADLEGNQKWFDINRIPLHDNKGKVLGLLISLEDITYRKEAENELQTSEMKYRNLIELLPEAIYEAKLDGVITYFNPTAIEIFKYEPNELKGMNLLELIIPKLHERVNKVFSKISKGQITKPHEYLMRKKDGTIFHVRAHSRPIYENGNIIGMRGIVSDIDEQKKAQQDLKISEKKYRHLFDMSPDMIILMNMEDQFIDANNSFLNFTGYKREILIGKKYEEINYYEKNLEYFNNYKQRLQKEKTPQPIELQIQRRDEKLIWVSLEASLIELEGDDLIYIIMKDVHEKKIAQEKLRESEIKYRHLFNNSPYAIWLVDMDGIIIDCNETMNNFMVFYKKEDLIRVHFIDVIKMFLKNQDSKLDHYLTEFKERFTKLRQKKKLEPYEFEIVRGDGKVYWLTLESTFVKVGDKRFVQVLIKDVTFQKEAEIKLKNSEKMLKILNKELEQKVKERTKELKESEKKLRVQNIELKKLDELKNEFINTTSHELKTPLVSIAGYTDFILLKHNDLNPEIVDDLKIVKKNVDRLKMFIEQLSDVLKIDSKKLIQDIVLKEENMHHIIKNCVSELKILMENKDINVEIKIEENLRLNVDANRINQVFSNLLSNAVKFTPNKGFIEISSEEQENYYLFKVKDSGLGLTEEEIPKLFGKFVKLNNGQDSFSKGSGLGLFISKGIIEAHGGKIWAESTGRNQGTKFFFTIPKIK